MKTQITIDKDSLFELLDSAVYVVNQLRGYAISYIPTKGEHFDDFETECPYWPSETQVIYSVNAQSLTEPQNRQLLAFLETGAQAGFLCYRRLPKGFDWSPSDPEKYAQLCTDFKFNDIDFHVWRRY